MADSEVLTMEVVGEFLGYDQDQTIVQYFRRCFAHYFPALGLAAPVRHKSLGRDPRRSAMLDKRCW